MFSTSSEQLMYVQFTSCVYGTCKVPIKVLNSWIFLHRYFSKDFNTVAEQLYWRKIFCGCLRSCGCGCLFPLWKNALNDGHCNFIIPAGNYMFKVNNRNTRATCEKCSKLAIKTPERRPGLFIVNYTFYTLF